MLGQVQLVFAAVAHEIALQHFIGVIHDPLYFPVLDNVLAQNGTGARGFWGDEIGDLSVVLVKLIAFPLLTASDSSLLTSCCKAGRVT